MYIVCQHLSNVFARSSHTTYKSTNLKPLYFFVKFYYSLPPNLIGFLHSKKLTSFWGAVSLTLEGEVSEAASVVVGAN